MAVSHISATATLPQSAVRSPGGRGDGPARRGGGRRLHLCVFAVLLLSGVTQRVADLDVVLLLQRHSIAVPVTLQWSEGRVAIIIDMTRV